MEEWRQQDAQLQAELLTQDQTLQVSIFFVFLPRQHKT